MAVASNKQRKRSIGWQREARTLLRQIERQRQRLEELIEAAETTHPLQLFEEVRIVGAKGKQKAVERQLGIILGRSEGASGQWYYAVAIEAGDTWQIEGQHLEPTGRVFSRDAIYSGTGDHLNVSLTGRITHPKATRRSKS